MQLIQNGVLNSEFQWLNRPDFTVKGDILTVKTSPGTDFWQRTHYGFRNDNGHCLLTETRKDFLMAVKTEYEAVSQYDQCGLMARLDSENWIKTSTEFETSSHSRLGSVVTNLGYSDWATVDLQGPVREMWYRIQSKNNLSDFLLEYSADGSEWKQLRIAHLHQRTGSLLIGIYACSPMESRFPAVFSSFLITDTEWKEEG